MARPSGRRAFPSLSPSCPPPRAVSSLAPSLSRTDAQKREVGVEASSRSSFSPFSSSALCRRCAPAHTSVTQRLAAACCPHHAPCLVCLQVLARPKTPRACTGPCSGYEKRGGRRNTRLLPRSSPCACFTVLTCAGQVPTHPLDSTNARTHTHTHVHTRERTHLDKHVEAPRPAR